MSTVSPLRIDGEQLVLDTPWQSTAQAEILVNGSAQLDGWGLALHGKTDGELEIEVQNNKSSTQRLDTVAVRWAPAAFSMPLQTCDFRELVNGASFLQNHSGVRCVGRDTPGLPGDATSSLLTVIAREDGPALLLGVLPPFGAAFTEFLTLHSAVHREGTFGIEMRFLFGCTVAPGARMRTPTLIARAGPDGVDCMADYGAMWTPRTGRPCPKKALVGWNSWDYWAGAITQDACDTSLADARRLFGDAVQFFVIDEGWECQWGSWQANWKFPDGLRTYCEHVTDQGGTPGIWTAPLLVHTGSALLLDHPDWFAADPDGQLAMHGTSFGPMGLLDPTHPGVQEYLRSVFTHLRDAGFRYFKVDFTQCVLKASRFSDESVGRADLIRRAFAAIRDAVGPDAYMLSCGAPFESVMGIVDAVRTTGDIHIFWSHILQNAGALAARWWMHGNAVNADPDFLVVRGPDTAAPPYGKREETKPRGLGHGWKTGRIFNESEARVCAFLIHINGGDVFLGDHLDALNQTGIDILKRVLVPRAQGGRPVDLFQTDQDLPRIWINRGTEDTLVGLFNWTDKPAHLLFAPADHGLNGTLNDFWTDEPMQNIPTRIPAHGCMALRFKN